MAILKQTALSITNTSNVLTMTWKLADFYTSQEAYWSIDGQETITPLLGTDTSVSYTIPVANYYPATEKKLPSVTIGVRGIISGVKGPWVTSTYKFVAPNAPVVTKGTLKFIWATNTDYIAGKGEPNVIDVEYQRVDSTSATQNQVVWGTDSSSSNFTDVTGQAATDEVSYLETNKVEWFRCCSRGLNGQSAWVYAYHVNAMPYAATDLVAKPKGKSITLTWKPTTSAEHPMDYQQIQYCYATPTAENAKGIPLCPVGVTWVSGETNIVPKATTATFEITQFPPVDQALFIRVASISEGNTAYSDPIFAMAGSLTAPTLSSVVSDPITKTTVLTFVDNSTCGLSKMACVTSAGRVLGTVAHGVLSITVKGIPTSKNLFGIRAYQGSAASKPNMRSDDTFLTAGNVPLAPTNVSVIATEREGVAEVSWQIPWSDAEGAEISWADHDDAWESTSQPDSFVIDQRATWWNVADLAPGNVYYFRVRLKDTSDTFSPYSPIVSLSLASAPGKPVLTSSAIAVQPGEAFQLAWTYESTDTTDQATAIIYDNGTEIARVDNNAQRMSLTPAWTYGSSHPLTVRTISKSGIKSVLSDAVTITVAAAPSIGSLTTAITAGITGGVLEALPIMIKVTGAGKGGRTTIKIERLGDYFVDRPDGSLTEGYDGETVYAVSYSGESQLSIMPEDLVGSFDDGGNYRLTATVQDSVGQKASAFLDFVVTWTHQAEKPTASVTVNSDLTAKVKAVAPASYVAGDTVDIYRLSADKPELIVKGGDFGQFYLDPYPASKGGYRFVDVTSNGDYTTATGIAWLDKTCDLTLTEAIIDFNKEQLALPYNLELSNSWEKDFEETKYLNGHVVGDWNAAISRTGSISAVLQRDDARVAIIRDLAAWNGVCHVRTPDGSSYSANVEVSESMSHASKSREYTFSITRVDPETYEGIAEETT